MRFDSRSCEAVSAPARKPRRLVLLGVAAVMAFGFVVPGGVLHPEQAQAHNDCYDFWKNSGHTKYAQWYHCHDFRAVDPDRQADTVARVHICGYSGKLHGITVRHHHVRWGGDFYSRTNAREDLGGEGCRPRRR